MRILWYYYHMETQEISVEKLLGIIEEKDRRIAEFDIVNITLHIFLELFVVLRCDIMGFGVAKSHYITARHLAPIVTLF